MNELLPVFNIERFAFHDGAGIRTAVFLQGCPMRCPWCANPESQTIGKNILHISKACTGCGKCAEKCPQKAVSVINGNAEIDRIKCISCGKCVEICLNKAMKISGKKMSADKIFEIILRDKDYYEQSGGGVTFSGGEALLHIDGLIPLLEKCRENSIRIAFETCGCVPIKNVEKALEYADEFLFDIKSLDGEKLKKITGGDNRTIISAFEIICKKAVEKITVRVPVIPGFNDSEIISIMEFAAVNGVIKLHLLPYHTLGISKYEQLGLNYPYSVRESLSAELIEPYVDIGGKFGLAVKIGG